MTAAAPSTGCPPLPPPVTPAQWLERGHHCAAGGHHDDLLRALACYDHARGLSTSAAGDAFDQRHLGLAWMNRGNILQQLGHPIEVEAALNAYDVALATFRSIATRPGIANTVATVHLNRGRAHQRRGDHPAAIADYRRALDELSPLVAGRDVVATRNAAGAAINLAQLLLAVEHDPVAARPLLARARDWLAPTTTADPVAATLALEAMRLELVVREPDLTRETFGDFTDTLETALDLAATWIHRDHPTAEALGASLFQLGATAYAQNQPHFLVEFLRDSLDPLHGPAPFASSPEFHRIATDHLRQLRAELRRPRLLSADDEASHNIAHLLRELDQPMPWLQPPDLHS